MNKIKFPKALLISIIVLIILSLSVYAKVTLDETKIYLKTTPIDYIAKGEDYLYDSWNKIYIEKRRNYQTGTPSVKSKIIGGNIRKII